MSGEETAIATRLASVPAASVTNVFRRGSWSRAAADDIDPVVIDRLMTGQPTHCTAWERREAVKQLRLAGNTYSQIAATLRIGQEQVARDLRRAGLTRRCNNLVKGEARRRRTIVERLAHAGLRPVEIHSLLPSVSYQRVMEDMHQLGFRPGAPGSRSYRSRDELLAAFGHLLCVEAAS